MRNLHHLQSFVELKRIPIFQMDTSGATVKDSRAHMPAGFLLICWGFKIVVSREETPYKVHVKGHCRAYATWIVHEPWAAALPFHRVVIFCQCNACSQHAQLL